MADQLELGDPGVQPPVETPVVGEVSPPAETPPPTAEEELRRLREDNARLSGENAVLREKPRGPEPPESARPTLDTPEAVEAAFASGTVTDSQRVQLLASIAADRRIQERDARTRLESSVTKAQEKLGILLVKYPALKDPASPLLQAVSAELRTMAELGVDPQDVRAQVKAVETVLKAQEKPTVDPAEYHRRKTPVGGGAVGASGEPPPKTDQSKGKALFGRLTSEAQDFYKSYHNGNLDAIYKTLEHADEGMLRRSGRFAQ